MILTVAIHRAADQAERKLLVMTSPIEPEFPMPRGQFQVHPEDAWLRIVAKEGRWWLEVGA
jgi:hypothetical protein